MSNPEISSLIDDFGLMLKQEWDERSEYAERCYYSLYRWCSEPFIDPRNGDPRYKPLNMFQGFWRASYVPPSCFVLESVKSSRLVQLTLF